MRTMIVPTSCLDLEEDVSTNHQPRMSNNQHQSTYIPLPTTSRQIANENERTCTVALLFPDLQKHERPLRVRARAHTAPARGARAEEEAPGDDEAVERDEAAGVDGMRRRGVGVVAPVDDEGLRAVISNVGVYGSW